MRGRKTGPIGGIALVALALMAGVGVVVAAGILRGGSASTISAGSPIVVAATISPRASLFGDTVTARVELAADPRRVEPQSLRIDGRFGPYAAAAQPLVVRRTFAGRELLTWTVQLRCLEAQCRPRNAVQRVVLPSTRVTYSTVGDGSDRRSMAVDWPDLLVYSRVDQAEVAALNPLDQPPWRAEVRSLPTASYAFPPGLLAGTLLVASAILIVLALLLSVPMALREVRARAELAPTRLPPLEQALVLLESKPDGVGSVEPRRQALELVAEELGKRGEQELELSARRLAWSAAAPAFEDTRALAGRVRAAAASSNGSGA